MEWIEAIRRALIDLNGSGTEPEILRIIEKKGYRKYDNARTPQRSLNMYLHRDFKDEVERQGDRWTLITYQTESKSIEVFNEFIATIVSSNNNTIKGIKTLEDKMKGRRPAVKDKISKYIERGVIANKVKQVTKYKCLVCEKLGTNPYSFSKPNGDFYVETHHIEPVSTVKAGVLSLNNLITVCANHHRQLHYGNAFLLKQTKNYFTFMIDGNQLQIKKIELNELPRKG